jgi:hypothetical protein
MLAGLGARSVLVRKGPMAFRSSVLVPSAPDLAQRQLPLQSLKAALGKGPCLRGRAAVMVTWTGVQNPVSAMQLEMDHTHRITGDHAGLRWANPCGGCRAGLLLEIVSGVAEITGWRASAQRASKEGERGNPWSQIQDHRFRKEERGTAQSANTRHVAIFDNIWVGRSPVRTSIMRSCHGKRSTA